MAGSINHNPLVAQLLAEAPLNELGRGQPLAAKKSLLKQLSETSMVAPNLPHDRQAALACNAGLWLRYDFWEESHGISQNLPTAEGSYWHAILHRREPDAASAKYWFRRVGQHPVFAELLWEGAKLAKPHTADPNVAFLNTQTAWDPLQFVDLCECARGGNHPLEQLCREIQRREWDLLFDFCYRQAAAV